MQMCLCILMCASSDTQIKCFIYGINVESNNQVSRNWDSLNGYILWAALINITRHSDNDALTTCCLVMSCRFIRNAHDCSMVPLCGCVSAFERIHDSVCDNCNFAIYIGDFPSVCLWLKIASTALTLKTCVTWCCECTMNFNFISDYIYI